MWEHNDVHHVDHFYGYLRHCLVSMNAQEFLLHLIEVYAWWTYPTSSYYHCVLFMLHVDIPSEPPPPPLDDAMSFLGFDSSSDDYEATPSILISP